MQVGGHGIMAECAGGSKRRPYMHSRGVELVDVSEEVPDPLTRYNNGRCDVGKVISDHILRITGSMN